MSVTSVMRGGSWDAGVNLLRSSLVYEATGPVGERVEKARVRTMVSVAAAGAGVSGVEAVAGVEVEGKGSGLWRGGDGRKGCWLEGRLES